MFSSMLPFFSGREQREGKHGLPHRGTRMCLTERGCAATGVHTVARTARLELRGWPKATFAILSFGWSNNLTSEKVMAPHSSTLAWKIPWTEEPGRLQSMGLRRVWRDWATSLSLFTFMHWRRKWQPTPVFLPGESQGRGSLVGCRLWGRTESDRTEVT